MQKVKKEIRNREIERRKGKRTKKYVGT